MDHKDDGNTGTPKANGDMEDVLQAQGYSRSKIAEIQRVLDDGSFASSELSQLPMPVLQQYARSLEIEGVKGLQKEALVSAIRQASN